MISFGMFFLLASFAVFRISEIMVNERGPFDLVLKFRELIGIEHGDDLMPIMVPEKFLPLLFSCVGCTSVWVGFAVALIYLTAPTLVFLLVVMPFGLSGAAVMIDSLRYKG